MAKFTDLPSETILDIVEALVNLHSGAEDEPGIPAGPAKALSSLARTCRQLYEIINPELYHHEVNGDFFRGGEFEPVPLVIWAVEAYSVVTLKYALEAGASVNTGATSVTSREDFKIDPGLPEKERLRLVTRRYKITIWEDDPHYGADTSDDEDDEDDNKSEEGEEEEAEERDEKAEEARQNPSDIIPDLEESFPNDAATLASSSSHRGDVEFADADGPQQDRPLHIRAQRRNPESLNANPDEFYWPALHVALRVGSIETVTLLLSNGASSDDPGTYNGGLVNFMQPNLWRSDRVVPIFIPTTPLFVAILSKQEELARLLISRGASLRISRPGEVRHEEYPPVVTALHVAAYAGLNDLIRHLIGLGISVHERDELCQTAIAWAVDQDMWESVRLLQSLGAGIDPPQVCNSLLINACYSNTSRVPRLLELGADVHATWTASNFGPLHALCMDEDLVSDVDVYEDMKDTIREVIESLVEKGVEVDGRDREGRTPLMLAAKLQHIAAVKTLIKLGADVNATNGKTSSLHRAFRGTFTTALSVEMVELLLSHGAEVNAMIRGLTPLHALAIGNNQSGNDIEVYRFRMTDWETRQRLLEILLDAGADPNLADPEYRELSPLIAFFKQLEDDACSLLLERGFKVGDGDLNEMLELVAEHRCPEMLNVVCKLPHFGVAMPEHFLQNGSAWLLDLPTSRPTFDNVTKYRDALGDDNPLDSMADHGFAHRLHDAGVLPAASKIGGLTALHIAVAHGCAYGEEIGKLIDEGADINAVSSSGFTPLHIIVQAAWGWQRDGEDCKEKSWEVAKLLVERGANIHQETIAVDGGEQVPRPLQVMLTIALSDSSYDSKKVHTILTMRPLRGDADARGGLYIHWLLRQSAKMQIGSFTIPSLVDALVATGADLNEADENGDTALSFFLRFVGQTPDWVAPVSEYDPPEPKEQFWPLFFLLIVSTLQAGGSNLEAQNKEGKTPLRYLDDLLSYSGSDARRRRIAKALPKLIRVEWEEQETRGRKPFFKLHPHAFYENYTGLTEDDKVWMPCTCGFDNMCVGELGAWCETGPPWRNRSSEAEDGDGGVDDEEDDNEVKRSRNEDENDEWEDMEDVEEEE